MKGLNRWIAIGVAAVLLIGALSIDPVRSLAADVLQVFRVKQAKVVRFDPAEIQQLADALKASGQKIDLDSFGRFEKGSLNDSALVDAGTVTISGTRIAIPEVIGDYRRDGAVQLSQGQRLSVTPKVEGINSFLAGLGSTTPLPDSLNGRTFTLEMPGVVSATFTVPGTDDRLSLRRSLSPSLTVPAGVDVEQVRSALLSIPVLPDGMRSTLAGIDISGGTMLIPDFGLASHGGSVKDVSVNGAAGVLLTLLEQDAAAGGAALAGRNLLIWAHDGIWNCLGGDFTLAQGLTLAAALE